MRLQGQKALRTGSMEAQARSEMRCDSGAAPERGAALARVLLKVSRVGGGGGTGG